VGGCGHVGLPLGITLADSGVPTIAFDIASDVVARVNEGVMPFRETGAEPVLARVLASGAFHASDQPQSIYGAEVVILVIGTPVDDHLNPDPNAVVAALDECIPFMDATKLVILRSTVFPGVTARVRARLRELGLTCDVAFCPERIVEGQAIHELRSLPQIIGAWTEEASATASAIFEAMGVRTIHTLPEEAELAKLFTNTWRYIKFAAANQFWLMANEAGLDFARIREAIRFDYPRAADLPGPGFAAGPCLFKDTMQLAAFTNNNFTLGHAAMMVNEGQPLYVVDRIGERFDLST
jgi:UDP-N-acetyl-D-mannosaminuronic acid dehydrogenase